MEIISRATWGARHPRGFRTAPLPARELYLHHSVTAAPANDPAAERAAVRTLENIGQSRFGGGISYTFAVAPSGRVYEGHGIDRQGAHTGGRNSIARAICLIGNYDANRPPEAMIQAVADLVRHGHAQGWWPARLTGGHRDAPGASTACPGRHAHALIAEINRRATAGPRPGPSPVPPPSGDDEDMGMQMFTVPPTKGVASMRLAIPVGKMSSVTGRAWVSMVGNGPAKATGRVWAQDDDSGIADRWFNMPFADGRSARDWWELPDGTTQINVHYDMPNGGCITLEWRGK